MVVCIHACMYAAVSSGLPVLSVDRKDEQLHQQECDVPPSSPYPVTLSPTSGPTTLQQFQLPVLVEADENGTPISRETTFTFDPASGQPCSDPLPPLCDSVVGGAEDHPLTPTTSLCSLHKEPL